jgi:8-oxo-dGTP pyrophosphatase MutT (NUDIX family)
MESKDILFKTKDFIFSYRVAGILIYNGKVLLQKPIDDDGFAFPGGHVAFSETNEETLIREFKEEIGLDIIVKNLKWVAEVFFPWDGKPCHQICLYYIVELMNYKQIPLEGKFIGTENIENNTFKIEFHWIPIEGIKDNKIYPTNCVELLEKIEGEVIHFVYKEK